MADRPRVHRYRDLRDVDLGAAEPHGAAAGVPRQPRGLLGGRVVVGWGELFFLGWSASLLGLITLVAALDGGVSSPLTAIYFGPLAYAALCYSLPLMLTVAAIDIITFLGLALSGDQARFPYAFVFAGSLISVA